MVIPWHTIVQPVRWICDDKERTEQSGRQIAGRRHPFPRRKINQRDLLTQIKPRRSGIIHDDRREHVDMDVTDENI